MGLTRYFMKDRYYSLTNQITVFDISRIYYRARARESPRAGLAMRQGAVT